MVWYVGVDVGVRADDAARADRDSHRHDRKRSDERPVSDSGRRPLVLGPAAADRPLDGGVAVELRTGAYRAVRPDREAAAAVQECHRPDPGVLPDGHVAVDVRVVVQARARAEAKCACSLPSIEELVAERQAAIPSLAGRPVLLRLQCHQRGGEICSLWITVAHARHSLRRMPMTTMSSWPPSMYAACRSTPSRTNPPFSYAAMAAAFDANTWSATRSRPRSSKAWRS